MDIKFYNALTQNVEAFSPIDPNRVTMYVCGPTVYDSPHIGNARPSIVFDTVYRLLRHAYGDSSVVYARNFTDIDDKIMERASLNGENIAALTERNIAKYHQDMDSLSVLRPNIEPRATHTIPEMINMIALLISKGHAYEVKGHIYFDVKSWDKHGVISNHIIDNLVAGNDVIGSLNKSNSSDFVLWKPSTPGQPGWASRWGYGRPGWHIECSAMIKKHLGQTIDIHGGGQDLRFPHHECENSQSHAANGQPLANYWMHNGMIRVDGRKMAKSLGNVINIEEAVSTYGGDVVRLAIMGSHYRHPLNWTTDAAQSAHKTLRGWHRVLEGKDGDPEHNEVSTAILGHLANDLNTVAAVAEINATLPKCDSKEVVSGIRYAAGILGFDLVNNDEWLRGGDDRDEIEQLISMRASARLARDWEESDRIRDVLTTKGITIEDNGGEYSWTRR